MVSYDKGQSVVLSSLITKIIHVFTSSLIIILKNVNNRAIYLIETSPQKEPKPLKKIFTVAFQKLSYHKR